MLEGAGLAGAWHHSRAHDFFARRRWDPDELGMALLDFFRDGETTHGSESRFRFARWALGSGWRRRVAASRRRSRGDAAKELLGEDFGSFIITDRYAGYHWLDVLQQQLCWAHLICQVTEISERPGAPGKLAARLLDTARDVIRTHRAYLQDGRDLKCLEHELRALRDQFKTLLQQGTRARHKKTSRFAAGLLEEFDALWTFCEVPGIDPTNNAADRALRHGVIMRKVQLGTQSQAGNRWIKRICSARETCMLQRRSVLAYLIDAATAAHHGQPIPSLAPT